MLIQSNIHPPKQSKSNKINLLDYRTIFKMRACQLFPDIHSLIYRIIQGLLDQAQPNIIILQFSTFQGFSFTWKSNLQFPNKSYVKQWAQWHKSIIQENKNIGGFINQKQNWLLYLGLLSQVWIDESINQEQNKKRRRLKRVTYLNKTKQKQIINEDNIKQIEIQQGYNRIIIKRLWQQFPVRKNANFQDRKNIQQKLRIQFKNFCIAYPHVDFLLKLKNQNIGKQKVLFDGSIYKRKQGYNCRECNIDECISRIKIVYPQYETKDLMMYYDEDILKNRNIGILRVNKSLILPFPSILNRLINEMQNNGFLLIDLILKQQYYEKYGSEIWFYEQNRFQESQIWKIIKQGIIICHNKYNKQGIMRNLEDTIKIRNKFQLYCINNSIQKQQKIFIKKNKRQIKYDVDQVTRKKQMLIFTKNYQTKENNRFMNLTLIGQFYYGFLVCLNQNHHLILLDQHASSQKILYQKFIKPSTLVLSQPIQISLNLSMLNKFKLIQNQLINWQIQLQQRQSQNHVNSILIIKKIPLILDKPLTSDYLINLLQSNQQYDNYNIGIQQNQLKKLGARKACHKAFRVGQKLQYLQMVNLLKQLCLIQTPYNCPHGRPTLIEIDKFNSELVQKIELKKQYIL